MNQQVANLLINEVAKRTGVNAVTLRAWERRYGLIKPERTPKGHRLYSEHDIGLIEKIVALVRQGITISQVKTLLDSEGLDESPEEINFWQQWVDRLIHAVLCFDVNKLDNQYNQLLSLYPIDVVTKHVILPLMKQLGSRWKSSPTGIAEEHFFSFYFRNKLGARLHHMQTQAHGKTLILACLPGEYHEFGLMLFAIYFMSRGFKTIIFGTDLPLAQIPKIQKKLHASAVVLKGKVNSEAKQALVELDQEINIPVFCEGSISGLKHIKAISSDYDLAYATLHHSLTK